jgi:hypothetical protein
MPFWHLFALRTGTTGRRRLNQRSSYAGGFMTNRAAGGGS